MFCHVLPCPVDVVQCPVLHGSPRHPIAALMKRNPLTGND